MESERQAFLDAIAAAPGDLQLRSIYGDWLEEHGEPEEAARQRNWPRVMEESRRWLTEFGERLGGKSHYGELDDPLLTWEQLVEVAVDEMKGNYNDLMLMGTNEEYKNMSTQQWDEFWDHVEVLTGRRLEHGRKTWIFSCGC